MDYDMFVALSGTRIFLVAVMAALLVGFDVGATNIASRSVASLRARCAFRVNEKRPL
jgi:hypothetical protein